ncbi:MAG TPA: hypothetical protein VFH01_03690 [Pyrinomonadaceae bacterium]|nr:hypothetical protein [Pyrinomonadaceae bacterium]
MAGTYWANLSPAERVLLWLGFVAFFITIVSATGLKVVTLFGQAVIDTMSKPSTRRWSRPARLVVNDSTYLSGSAA